MTVSRTAIVLTLAFALTQLLGVGSVLGPSIDAVWRDAERTGHGLRMKDVASPVKIASGEFAAAALLLIMSSVALFAGRRRARILRFASLAQAAIFVALGAYQCIQPFQEGWQPSQVIALNAHWLPSALRLFAMGFLFASIAALLLENPKATA